MFTRQKEIADQRQMKRYSLFYQFSVIDRNTQQQIGHLIDLSMGGAMLVSDQLIKTGVKISLRIILPSPFMDTTYFDIEAQTVRVQNDVNVEYFTTGVRFSNVDSSSQQFIEYLIENYSL